ncbi:DUF4192 family protein [Demequina sp.]|uniref:DUF4192 family protein n=1 Tax=Demequina sp. TaxID=2050685 RepID=UPI003D133ED1
METIKVSLGELIAALPTAIGHVPHESVVAVSINDLNLPTCVLEIPREVLLAEESASVTAAAVAEELAAQRGQRALLVSYTERDVREHCEALEALRLEVEFLIPQVEALAFQDGEWFRPGCDEEGCCPRPLPPLRDELVDVITAARRHAEREEEAYARAMEHHVRRWEGRALAASAWEQALAEGAVADATTARQLAASLDDLCVRDWVVLTILGADRDATEDALVGMESGAVAYALDRALVGTTAPDLLSLERARAVVERVARAARGRRRRAATQTLGAVLEWWEGNLEAAAERCSLALTDDHSYRLAELVAIAADRGIAPGWAVKAGQTAQ